MPTTTIGISEFRKRLYTYIHHADGPIAITRHGKIIGHFIPILRKLADAGRNDVREPGYRAGGQSTAVEVEDDEELIALIDSLTIKRPR